MRQKGMLLLLSVCLVMATSAGAVEWNNKLGFGYRAQLYAPFGKGAGFDLDGNSNALYMMGPGEGFFIQYGLTRNLALHAELEFVETFDDTTATSNQTFKWRNSDFAKSHLRGHLISVSANYYFKPESKLQPYVLGGLGLDYWRVRDRSGTGGTYHVKDIGLKIGAGLNYWVFEWLTVEAQLKFTGGLFNAATDMDEGFFGAGDWSEWDTRPFRHFIEPSVAAAIYFGGAPDQDDDGVKDSKDKCPDTPRGAVVDKQGCPLDEDGDGVYDGLDSCAATPAGVKVDQFGCPLDTDGDGVWDSWDKCPKTPTGVAVDDKGCPLDGDMDGVPDYLDKCADTPAGATVNTDGCPMDTDGDGVYDGLDKCPKTIPGVAVDKAGCMLDEDKDGVADAADQCPGTPALVVVDEVGCPVAKRITKKITLDRSVGFKISKSGLSDDAKAALDGVVQSLRAYVDTKVKISGFCDSTGPAGYNQTLSEERAKVVKDYLVAQGIAADRMTATGYGENPDYFVADNETAAGRARNRRVEIESITE
ncbi:MAG: OmpA family protein [bacterium]